MFSTIIKVIIRLTIILISIKYLFKLAIYKTNSGISATFPKMFSGTNVKIPETIANAHTILFFNNSIKIQVPFLCMNNRQPSYLCHPFSKMVSQCFHNFSYKMATNLVLF